MRDIHTHMQSTEGLMWVRVKFSIIIILSSINSWFLFWKFYKGAEDAGHLSTLDRTLENFP